MSLPLAPTKMMTPLAPAGQSVPIFEDEKGNCTTSSLNAIWDFYSEHHAHRSFEDLVKQTLKYSLQGDLCCAVAFEVRRGELHACLRPTLRELSDQRNRLLDARARISHEVAMLYVELNAKQATSNARREAKEDDRQLQSQPARRNDDAIPSIYPRIWELRGLKLWKEPKVFMNPHVFIQKTPTFTGPSGRLLQNGTSHDRAVFKDAREKQRQPRMGLANITNLPNTPAKDKAASRASVVQKRRRSFADQWHKMLKAGIGVHRKQSEKVEEQCPDKQQEITGPSYLGVGPSESSATKSGLLSPSLSIRLGVFVSRPHVFWYD